MLDINNKLWEKLKSKDIEQYLADGEENYFFEYKSDEVTPPDLIKEISAFSNTYGGYIFLGVADDKTVKGCKIWNEQRITTTIYSCLTPIPIFDIKKFNISGSNIFVIKIEEGNMPPYITNKGAIYERVSSSSCKITSSIKLTQLFNKTDTQNRKTAERLCLLPLALDNNIPNNLCAYLDFGFEVYNSRKTILEKNWFAYDFTRISEYVRTLHMPFSISRVGNSFTISIGAADTFCNNEPIRPIAALSNFLEIMFDGSVKGRILLINDNNQKVEIANILFGLKYFAEIYKLIFGKDFYKHFIYALKYEKLTVIKQFTPYYSKFEDDENLKLYLNKHKRKYGNNLIINGNRIPSNDFITIDKRLLESNNLRYNNENLVNQLFGSYYTNLGYIDPPTNF